MKTCARSPGSNHNVCINVFLDVKLLVGLLRDDTTIYFCKHNCSLSVNDNKSNYLFVVYFTKTDTECIIFVFMPKDQCSNSITNHMQLIQCCQVSYQ